MSNNSKFWAIIVLNFVIVGFEIAFGVVSNSIALITDAFHNLGDIVAVIISFIATLFAKKSPTIRNSYGYIRSEMMATFVNSLLLILTMLFLLYETVVALFSQSEAVDGSAMILVATIALFANGISAYLLLTLQKGKKDLNIRSAYLHFLADSLLSFSVIVGGLVIYFFGIFIVDKILSLIFSIYIIYSSLPLLRRSFFSLMDLNHSIDASKIEKKVLEFDEVESIHDVHVLEPSQNHSFFYAHIVVKDELSLQNIDDLIDKIEKILFEFGINHSVIQPESAKHSKLPLIKETYS
ncbi:cation diffusion facilitator family transporter [Thiovulum sp. ES]|nr:cation diffusion facilitator family transporter [Thiovulum sp. ES]